MERNLGIGDKTFLIKTAKIAFPIAFQTLLATLLNMIDTVMIGQLGEASISAVGLANKYFFVFSLLLFGITSGAGILTAQYWGKHDITNIRRVLGLSVMLGVLGAVIFLLPALLCPRIVMRIFTTGEQAVSIGASYLAIVAVSYPITAVTTAYTSSLRGVNQVRTPVMISLVSILVNVVFNYIFIFGKLGAPALGVEGAAIATVIARIVECAMLLLVVYIKNSPAAARVKEMKTLDNEFLRKFFITVSPVIANEFMWGLGTTLYSLAYGRMGDSAVASITITQTVEQLFSTLSQGLGAAAVVILGNELGANKLSRAERYAKSYIILQFIIGFFVAGLCFMFRGPILSMFEIAPQTVDNANRCLLVFCLAAPVKMFNFINIVGILRSGGDTKAALILDTTSVWLIGVPAAFLSGLLMKLPIYLVYACVTVEEVYKAVLGYVRYRKKKWLCNLVKE